MLKHSGVSVTRTNQNNYSQLTSPDLIGSIAISPEGQEVQGT